MTLLALGTCSWLEITFGDSFSHAVDPKVQRICHFFCLVYGGFRCDFELDVSASFASYSSHPFFSLFPPLFKTSNLVKIAQWSESFYTETLSCQLSTEGDESEDKKVRVRLAVQARTEGGRGGGFKVPVFLSTRGAAVIDEKVYRIGFISAAYFCPSPTVFASKGRCICVTAVFRLSIFKCGCTCASG